MKKTTNSTKIPKFITKLYQIVSIPEIDDVISWSDDGSYFQIKDLTRFESEICPTYFKHQKYSSFVRQLNLYSFHPVKPYDTSMKEEKQFKHCFFKKNEEYLLTEIKKKTSRLTQNINDNSEILMKFSSDWKNLLKNMDVRSSTGEKETIAAFDRNAPLSPTASNANVITTAESGDKETSQEDSLPKIIKC